MQSKEEYESFNRELEAYLHRPEPTKYIDGTPVIKGTYSASLDSVKLGEALMKGLIAGNSGNTEDYLSDYNPKKEHEEKLKESILKLKNMNLGEIGMKFIMDAEWDSVQDYKDTLSKHNYEHKDINKYGYGNDTIVINTLEELLQLVIELDGDDLYISDNLNGSLDLTIMNEQGEILEDEKKGMVTKSKSKEVKLDYFEKYNQCPNCRGDLDTYLKYGDKEWKPEYCPRCGQKLIWKK
jgi:DNA-directed RNA polymerase subunit RPC12/RpoP